MSQVRLAVVFFKLFGCEDVLSIRLCTSRLAAVFVEGIHDKRAVDLDRLVILFSVEHQPAAEPPHRRMIRLVEHGIRPHGHNLLGHFRLVVSERPGERLAPIRLLQIELCTTGHDCQQRCRHR